MKITAGKITHNKTLAFLFLVCMIMLFETVYAGQRKIVPDNVQPGIIKDTCLIATPRLAKIPELHGFWDPSFLGTRDSVWYFSGSNRAETFMSYSEMRHHWPYKYLRYIAKGQQPNYYWDQDQELEANYFQGQISVTISNGQGQSLWEMTGKKKLNPITIHMPTRHRPSILWGRPLRSYPRCCQAR